MARARQPGQAGALTILATCSSWYGYGYLNRVRSSRRLEAECRRNIEEEALNARIAAYLAQLDAADDDSRERVNGGSVQAALTLLQNEREQMQAQRRTFEGTRRTPQIEGEPDARLVKDGQGRSIAGYNVQNAVDSKHKLIVHHEVVCAGNDLRQLLPMAQAVKQVLDQTRLCVVADAGYSHGEHLTACEADGITAYVALARGVNPRGGGSLFDRKCLTCDQQRDHFTCPAGATLIRKQISRADRITILPYNLRQMMNLMGGKEITHLLKA